MKDGTTFCLFKTKQEIMAKEEKQNIISNFLSGWQKLFGGAKEHTTPKAKPFPKNHFYSPEELEYLSQNKEGSLIDQWAVSLGKWAFEQGKDKSSPTKFAAVKWQNGLMATWIDGKLTPDTKDRQIGRLLLLKERGYELPERYENMAQDYEAQSLVGKYFVSNNDKSIIKIDSYDRGKLIFDAPSLVLKKWEDGSLSSNEEKVAYADFHKSLNEKYTIMEEERQKEFQEKLANFEDGKELYKGMHNLLRQTYPPTIGGSIPMELRTAHPVGFFDGKVIPVSWSLTSEKDIKVSVYTNHSNALSSITINEDNAYKAKSLLNSIAHAINNEKVNGLTRSLVNVLGNKLGEDKIFAKENNTPLLEAREGTVNAVTATNDGRVIAFNLNTHKEIPLHGKESVELMQALLFEGLDEQSRLRKELSIPKMKDYVESMEDEEDILSGNKELLPHGSKVDSLYGTYYSAEEEYSSYAQGTLPLAAEDKAELIADLQSSFMNFKQELQNMVEAYKDHDGVIDTNKVSKLEKLDRILNIEARGQTPVKPVPVATKRESPKESLQDAEAASKQNDLKEVKNINAEEVDQKAIKSFFGNVNYAPKKVKEESSRQVAPQRLTEKEKDDAISRIDKRIAELHRLGKEQSLKSNIGNSADSHRRGYLPSGTSPDGAQSVAPSDGKDNKKFPSKYLFLGNLAHFITSFNTNIGINASNFTKELYKGIGLHPHGKDVQVSEYINFSNDKGEKTTVRLSDHRANALSIIKKGGRAAEGYSIVIKVEDSPETKFKANKHSQVKEYVYDNPDRQRLLNIGKGIFDLLDRGEYTDLANANEINISPRGRQHKELRTPDGKLLGFTYQGKIYLYPEAKGFEPPVHEYTHLWAEALQDRNWKEWKNVVGMMKKSNLWNEVRDLHTELIATDDIAEEVLATYSGRRGAERLESKLKEIVASNKSMDEKTAETQAVTQMNNAVSKFWNVMSDFLHIHYTSAEEIADRVLYEYTKGLYPLNYEEVAQQKGKTKPYYVSVEEKDNGRWHRPEVEQRAAYQRYGEMMADKLSLQLTYGDMPWIKSNKQIPCDLSKKAYHGMDSFMLALDAEKNAYTLPIYISKEDIQANNLLVKSDAPSFPIIEEVGVTELYNIEQTNYPILHPKDYEELKVDSIASNRYKQSNELGQLLRKGAWQTAIAFDGKPSLASYSAKNDTIHVAPVQHYEKEQDFYRDLGMGLTRSTRKAEARKTSFESLSREELVSLVGSVILGQKNHFDVTTPQQTSMWKERLRKDPSYTKQVLSSADVASQIIMQRIDILKKGGNQDIDLRSSTPVEVDIDGNGIVESQENLVPDQKQSSNESQEQSDEVPRQEKRHMHR